jgi:hypothetical protein
MAPRVGVWERGSVGCSQAEVGAKGEGTADRWAIDGIAYQIGPPELHEIRLRHHGRRHHNIFNRGKLRAS